MLRANDEPGGKAVARLARWLADGSRDDKKKKKAAESQAHYG